jgi:hypothetical protein
MVVGVVPTAIIVLAALDPGIGARSCVRRWPGQDTMWVGGQDIG